jgi:hypothetical protein
MSAPRKSCAICGRPFEGTTVTTIRQAWIDAGGWGSIPDHAIVHARCDKAEIRRGAKPYQTRSDQWPKSTTYAPERTHGLGL